MSALDRHLRSDCSVVPLALLLLLLDSSLLTRYHASLLHAWLRHSRAHAPLLLIVVLLLLLETALPARDNASLLYALLRHVRTSNNWLPHCQRLFPLMHLYKQ